MSSDKQSNKDKEITTDAPHVHGPNCNHNHDNKPQPIINASPKIGRNAPCSCGSEKKFKKCCGK